MRKYITVKIPVLDDVDEMKVVDTFNEEQLWYVCALVHAYEKLENKSKKQQERIDKLRECIKNFLCTEEYINVNGIAIADNYAEVLDMLNEVSECNK